MSEDSDEILERIDARIAALESRLGSHRPFRQWRDLVAARKAHVKHMRETRQLLDGFYNNEPLAAANDVPAETAEQL